ncbi:pyridoxal phosphate-dependent decarboxylase family protein [Nocardia pseudobrasiliensis]|uniref:L-2,4-diaminobutyrate decarboxylase n=1 Tax=Nocardia pseudobrasiliensis TaxID=45979 RepID=A0A370HRZ2_9NOCA|nr:aspartate aminotransferase family protein [Nocardia pseudobrasiliensis]RDI61312.1 L-2,4-diaminobutyrate decarboxylase [Nocardia pseudobrasiliensis]
MSSPDPRTEFLTPAGFGRYREVLIHAADLVTAGLAEPTVPIGYGQLRQRIRAVPVAPERGVGLDAALDEVARLMIPYSTPVADPRYTAHLHCPPTISSLAAETVLSALNQSMDSFDQGPAASVVEEHVVRWMCAAVGYDESSDGVFTSGGTQSNLQGLLLARDHYARTRLGCDIRAEGLPPEAARWRVVCTAETHFTIARAMSVLGLGARAVVPVATTGQGRLDPSALVRTLDDCERAGERVIAIVANAGTTDFGVIDPLARVAAIARERGVWVHVDACAGGCLLLSDRHRGLLAGIESADSVAIDFHKLLFQAISCGALVVRHAHSLALIAGHADYLNPVDDEGADALHLVGKSLQTTRRFDALKVWVTLRALGRATVARWIDATVAAAAAARAAANAEPALRVLGAGTTNTVVIRWETADLDHEALDALNTDIRRVLAETGRALIGRTRVGGAAALKLTFVNPVCTVDLARELIAEIASCGADLARVRAERSADVRI